MFKQTALSLPVNEEQSLNEEEAGVVVAEAGMEVVLVEVDDVFVTVARVVVGFNVIAVVTTEEDVEIDFVNES